MSKPRLIVHIGSSRTGSSSLQRGLRDGRAALLAQGVLYPSLERSRHPFKHAAIAQAAKAGDAAALDAERSALLAEFSASGAKVMFLSDEALWGTQTEILDFFKQLKSTFQVEVLAIVRRYDELVEAEYKQALRSVAAQESRSIDAYWRDETVRAGLAYHRILSAWAGVADRVVVLDLAQAKLARSLITACFGALDLPTQGLPPDATIHPTPDGQTVLTLRTLRESHTSFEPAPLLAAATALRTARRAPLPVRHLLGRSERAALLAALREDRKALERDFGVVFSDEQPSEAVHALTHPTADFMLALIGQLSHQSRPAANDEPQDAEAPSDKLRRAERKARREARAADPDGAKADKKGRRKRDDATGKARPKKAGRKAAGAKERPELEASTEGDALQGAAAKRAKRQAERVAQRQEKRKQAPLNVSLDDLKIRRRIQRHARQLRPTTVRAEAIGSAWCLLVACVRNELPRIPAFLAHYRRLGVAHFLFVDNQSTDGLQDYLAEQPDCSAWVAEGSYKASNFGMDWCNHLLATYGVDKWCVTVDPDEFLVYPHCEYRGLRNLTDHMASIRQDSLFTVLIDAYGPDQLSRARLTADADPFEICPYFDRFNLTQRLDTARRNFWVQGGVRMRRFFADTPELAPALNKVPLVRWRVGLRYESSMHHLNAPELNCTVLGRPEAVSGVLFHFKYVNLLQQKAAEEMQRGEHYAGSVEYKAYLDAGDAVLFDPNLSVRYAGSRQMQRLGFMQAGTWF